MKLYDGLGPNPHVVRIFIAERGITGIETVPIDLRSGENRREPFLSRNPTGTLPALETDDGRTIAEITTICEYLDEVAPGASLIGATAEERAETRMWTRRIDLRICEPMVGGFRNGPGLKIFQDRFPCYPDAAAALAAIAQDGYAWLEKQMADGRTFVVGERLTLADILLYGFAAFGESVGQPVAEANTHIRAWFDRMKARPAASA
ncbi:MAG TPA: glutathione S-transferase family protein [Sphingomonadaceae bacterium]|nr:glutathione S-transferase family protein [Sphingomonadaceae bacterium]